MGGFAIIPKTITYKRDKIKESFLKRGFNSLKEVENKDFLIIYAPKFNNSKSFYTNAYGHFLFYTGTLWFRNNKIAGQEEQLIEKITNETLGEGELSGTYTLIIGTPNSINIIHDSHAVNRFFIDTEKNIISSSWLALMWNHENKTLNKEAIKEQLLLGFNLGTKTWINEIERVKSQQQLPNNINYKRTPIGIKQSIQFHNKEEAVNSSISLLQEIINSKLNSNDSAILGLSSGYDSRLVSSLIKENNKDKLNFFTFHKPGDKDPIIAKQIAKYFDKELRIENTESNHTLDKLEDTFHRSFLFFDGQCADLMQYSKDDYTLDFRKKIFFDQNFHLSGVGGEIFRNYANDHHYSIKFDFWINHYFNAGKIDSSIKKDYYKNTLKEIKNEVSKILNIQSNKISYKNRRLFYSNIWLTEWHGLRNTIENQYMHYYSPFTEPKIIQLTEPITKYIGLEGSFEAAMIRSLSPTLAALDSEYGHDFNKIPYTVLIKSWIAGQVKSPFFSQFRKLKQKKENNLNLSKFEKEMTENLKETLNIPDAEWNRLIHTKKELILATAYIITQIKEN